MSNIGTQMIAGESCNALDCYSCDFLPFRCLECDLNFCPDHYKEHIFTKHDRIDDDAVSGPSSSEQPRIECAVEECKRPALISLSINESISLPCIHCQANFCITHRDPTSHKCHAYSIKTPEAVSRNAKAKELLAKNFSCVSQSKERKRSAPKQNLVIERMKLRQRAKPGEAGLGLESVAPNERFYVQVEAESGLEVFWFRKLISLGRAFDLLQSHLKLSPVKTWELYKESAEGELVQLHRFDLDIAAACTEEWCKLRLIAKAIS